MELATASGLLEADFDQLNRYGAVGLLLKPLLADLGRPCRILEVGCNVLDFLEDLLEPLPVEVVRCDVELVSRADNFVMLADKGPLPFTDDAFDFAVALEVLEHVPPWERTTALAEWARVAGQGIIFTCPLGSPAVASAEALANRAFHGRHGRPHPWLAEHQEFGLPTETDVRQALSHLGMEAHCWHNSPLAEWLPLLLLTEELNESVSPALRQLFNRHLNAGEHDYFTEGPAYRQVWCALKDERLAKRARALWRVLPAPARQTPETAVDPLIMLSGRLREAYRSMLTERELRDSHQEQQGVALLERRARELEAALREAQREQRRLTFALQRGQGRHASARSPILPPGAACHELVTVPSMGPGVLEALGDDPRIEWVQPTPPGWQRIVIAGVLPQQAAGKLYFDTGAGFCETQAFLLGNWHGKKLTLYLHLDQPAVRWRYDPMEAPGFFELRRLALQPANKWRYKLARVRAGLRNRSITCPRQYSACHSDYADWLLRHQISAAEAAVMLRRASGRKPDVASTPSLDVTLVARSADVAALSSSLDALAHQSLTPRSITVVTTEDWSEQIKAALAERNQPSERLRLEIVPRPLNLGSVLQNQLAAGQADYLVPMDAGDELAQHALLAVADALRAHPNAVVLYSDEGELDPAWGPHNPRFKPAWSPDLFLTRPYVGRLAAYQVEACRQAGGFRSQFRSQCEYDLILRLAARHPRGIVHLPRVLYHRAPGVVGSVQERARILRRLVHEKDGGIKGELLVADGVLRLRPPESQRAKVSIIIPTAGKKGVLQGQLKPFVLNCLRSLERSTLRAHETIVVDNGNLATDVERQLAARDVRRLSLLQPFNFAANLNQAARQATGDYLLFLNDDVEVITPDWLENLLDFALQPGVGAVGAKLYFPDGRLQHVGVLVPDAEPCHPYYGCQGEFEGYDQSVLWPRSFLAVTGACLLTPCALFLEMGGFDEAFSLNYNDVDYCLRLWERGYRSVYVPYAELVHYEAMGRGGESSVSPWELALFKKRWAAKLPRDPFDNLTPRRGTASTS